MDNIDIVVSDYHSIGGIYSRLQQRGVVMRKLNRLHMGITVAAVMSADVIATPALAIEFPIHANDLVPGERISTVVHGTGGGPQTGAHDLLLQRWVAGSNWSRLKAGQTDEAVNS